MEDRQPHASWRSLSATGLLLGTLLFAASLTPSLIPRTYVTQGVLGGVVFAIGYGAGVLGRWLWSYLELPVLGGRARRVGHRVVAVVCVITAAAFLWRTAGWQNSIRVRMGLEPLTSAHPFEVCAIAAASFVAVLAVARLVAAIYRLFAGIFRRYVPRRAANVIGAAVALLLLWSLATDVLAAFALRVLDSSFQQYDALIEPTAPRPTSPLKAGSPASLLGWEELGRAGREFVASGPSARGIAAASGREALEPIRVYVGLRAADTPAARARLALEELQRTGAFERSTLVVVTPTGTGWVDPAAMDSVEHLLGGDVASVAMQYSYLSSPLSLLVQPEHGAESARALFAQVYDHWRSLAREARPKLYLYGLSLGAMNSERSAALFEIFEDPIDGALWAGPPFESTLWRRFTEARNGGSPAWLPEFRDGSLVRFMNQDGAAAPPGGRWGRLRIVYLQYASDAITFFDPRHVYRRPDWMEPPRGPDVSPELRWVPAVTMLQLALDMAMANTTPMGYGHVFAPAHYVDAWLTLMDVEGWSPDRVAGLKEHLTRSAAAAIAGPDDAEEPYANRGG